MCVVFICAFVVGTEQPCQILQTDFLVGLYAQRQFFSVFTEVLGRCQLVHDVPLTYAEVLFLTRIVATAVGFPETEGFLAVPQLKFLGDAFHILRCHVVVFVEGVEPTYACDIGRYGNLVIGNAYGCPYASYFLGTFAKDLKNPYFLRVGNGQTLAIVSVTVFFNEVAY